MPISKLSVNTMLGSCKYDHKRQFIFTGSNTAKQNTANNNRIKARAVEKPCGCPNAFREVTNFEFNSTNALTIAIDLWITNKQSAITTYGEINTWNVSQITNMDNLFNTYSEFNDDISNWNVSNVLTMANMFNGAGAFNQPLNNWIPSSVTNMANMFNGAIAFNQPLDNWNTSSVTTMANMFNGASAFNQSLDNWNTSSVTTMVNMFNGAIAFNQLVYNWEWNVDNVGFEGFNNMFYNTNMPTNPNTPNTPNTLYFNWPTG